MTFHANLFTIPFWNTNTILQIINDVLFRVTQHYVDGLAMDYAEMANVKISMSSGARTGAASLAERPVICFPDKVFGGGEDRRTPSRHEIKQEFPEFPKDFDCWLLFVDPHILKIDYSRVDHGIGPKATYNLGRVKEGQLVESVDIQQFLDVLGFSNESNRLSDVSYWISNIEKTLLTETVTKMLTSPVGAFSPHPPEDDVNRMISFISHL